MTDKYKNWNLGAFWVLLIVFISYFLYSVSSILFPFALAAIISYLFDPLVNKIGKMTGSRVIGAVCFVLLSILTLVGVVVFVIPVVAQDLLKLLQNIPNYIDTMNNFIKSFFVTNDQILTLKPDSFTSYIKPILNNITSSAINNITPILHHMLLSGASVIHFATIILLTPIVMLYMLKDWPIIVNKMKNLLPLNYRDTILEQIGLVDKTLAGYLRGQFNVSIILAVYYATGLYLVELNSGLLVGLMVGLFTFVPYVGISVGIFIVSILSLMQFGISVHLIFVGLVFAIGMIMESSFLTPKLIGDKVGLHPLWMLFGMLSGAALCGPYGIITAVPITAILGVLIRFLVDQYLHSDYYKMAAPKRIK